jgi:enhancing lycopene biosynthesis protein 2
MKPQDDQVRAKKIAVLLNGCGHRDGSEIHEAVLTLLAIEKEGFAWEAVALNANQSSVINHTDGSTDYDSGQRNMLRESARIARGRIKDLSSVTPESYCALIIPGGNGTASNLCDFSIAGSDFTVNPIVQGFIIASSKRGIPIGAVCIAPILLARIFGESGVQLTLGDSSCEAARAASAMGARVQDCAADQCFVDKENRVVTTPAYMLDANISQIAQGISSLVGQVISMVTPR